MRPIDEFPTGPLISDLDGEHGTRRDPWLRQVGAPQWRAVRSVLVGLALVLVIVAFVRPLALPALFTSHPAPDVANVVILDSNVNTGTIILNGTPHIYQPWLHLNLQPGNNILDFLSPPFAALRCVLKHPLVSGGKVCQAKFSVANGTTYAPVINLDRGYGDLSADQQQAIEQTILAELTQAAAEVQGQIAPGQHFGSGGYDPQGSLASSVATDQLNATMVVVPNGTLLCDVYGTTAPLCPVSFGNAPASAGEKLWQVQVPAEVGWQFADEVTGQVTTDLLPVLATPNNANDSSYPINLSVVYADNGDWKLVPQMNSPNVASLFGQLNQINCTIGQNLLLSLLGNGNTTMNFSTEDPPSINGCRITLPNANFARFIERYGVLLAANSAAHQLLPAVPMAGAGEAP